MLARGEGHSRLKGGMESERVGGIEQAHMAWSSVGWSVSRWILFNELM